MGYRFANNRIKKVLEIYSETATCVWNSGVGIERLRSNYMGLYRQKFRTKSFVLDFQGV